jgi:hypothetical protein
VRDAFVASIRESNRQAAASWGRVAGHRARVTELLTSLGGGGGRLCLLGPGQLTDVALAPLLATYRTIDLVDIDPAAVEGGLMRQELVRCDAVGRHPAVDLTGVLDQLPRVDRGSAARPGPSGDQLVARLRRHRCRVSGAPFDVTASTGVLTQLLQSVVESVLEGEAADEVSLALRDKHLADLVALTRAEGSFVLVTDVVSTTSAPHLLTLPADRLEQAMSDLVAARNFFTGTNPYRICEILGNLPGVRDVTLEDPWLWPVTPDRSHLTYAVVARR